MSLKRRNSLVISSLLLTFMLPIVAALWVYYYGFPTARSTTNYGSLIQPSVHITEYAVTDPNGIPLSNKALLYKWTLLYVSPAVCDKSCESAVFYLRQMRTATGKDQERIRPVVLNRYGQSIDPSLVTLLQKRYPQTTRWISHADNKQLALEGGSLYLVDPHGNIMMTYPAGANPSKIFKDLTKLLRVSQIG
ncbi:MAG: hypothetical protein M3R00_08535 [Pseudomonadota bacterium]|nr:hypothetical protein [Pseudomonadota bacterium]